MRKQAISVSNQTQEPLKEGALSRLTFVVKDNIGVKGQAISAGNRVWQKTLPIQTHNAFVIDQLLCAGAKLAGTVVGDDTAFSLSGRDNQLPRQTDGSESIPLHNPFDETRICGGSSSGAAIAVAQGDADFALGTDTGGSIRVPASYCGLIGYRPSVGSVSMAGVMPNVKSTDTVGVICKNSDVLMRVGNALLGETPQIFNASEKRIFIIKEALSFCDDAIRRQFEKKSFDLKNNYTVVEISFSDIFGIDLMEFSKYAGACMFAEIASELGGYVAAFGESAFMKSVWQNFETTKSVPTEIAVAAFQKCQVFKRMANQFLSNNDFLCMPTVPFEAPLISESEKFMQPFLFTCVASILGFPQVTLPLAKSPISALPLGISLLAKNSFDLSLLMMADHVYTTHLKRENAVSRISTWWKSTTEKKSVMSENVCSLR